MNNEFPCWQCGKILTVMLPFSRREVCDTCNADQHACRMCKHYDPAVSDQCREDRAEAITDKERANFCDYFIPNPMAYRGDSNQQHNAAKAKLDALFGDALSETTSAASQDDNNAAAKKALDDLFNPPDSEN